jgi:predicted membrane protein
LDLTDLKVIEFVMKTGASTTEITMPANAGYTKAKVESGLGSMKIRFPLGVAGKIRTESGLASVSIDGSRFPRSGSVYISADYDEAENKVDLSLNTGVGSVEVV